MDAFMRYSTGTPIWAFRCNIHDMHMIFKYMCGGTCMGYIFGVHLWGNRGHGSGHGLHTWGTWVGYTCEVHPCTHHTYQRGRLPSLCFLFIRTSCTLLLLYRLGLSMCMIIAWQCKSGLRAETSPRHAPEAGLQGEALVAKSTIMTLACSLYHLSILGPMPCRFT